MHICLELYDVIHGPASLNRKQGMFKPALFSKNFIRFNKTCIILFREVGDFHLKVHCTSQVHFVSNLERNPRQQVYFYEICKTTWGLST